VHAGAVLQIRAKNANGDQPISDLVTLYATEGTVSVTPYLHQGDDVYVMQWACSNKGVKSATEKVQAHPPLAAPIPVTPIFDADHFVEIDKTIPGALVELYVNQNNAGLKLAGAVVATNLGPTVIFQNTVLNVGDLVQVKQFLCGDSAQSTPVRVTPAFGARPFYIVGHNPNTIAEVKTALQQGANAMEPDVNVFSSDGTKLCISHGEGDAGAPTLVAYLKDLHTVAVQNPQLALIVFDCKTPAAKADFGLELLNAIRTNLTFDIPLNVILSVASFGETGMFDKIYGMLGPREGIMIDEENDPVAVRDLFVSNGAKNRCYGNGNHFFNATTSPNLRPSIEHACGIRAGEDAFKFIYIWPINSTNYMREAIRIGVDGIITDDIGTLKSVVTQDVEFQGVIRMATRADNPFKQPNAAYGLYIHTGDVNMGGTDAHLTFTLTGSKGTRSKTIDAELNGRMERNDWNFVTIPSPDLGDLISITVERDNAGNGPDWFLDRIIVKSARYGVSKQADYNMWIDSVAKFTKPLV
jgi:CheY-like chemotaxis protein